MIEVTSSGLTHSWEDNPGEPNRYRVGSLFTGKGFGVIKIDWNEENTTVHLQIRDEQNAVRTEYTVSLDELAAD